MQPSFVRVVCGLGFLLCRPEGSVLGHPCYQGWLLYLVAVFRLTILPEFSPWPQTEVQPCRFTSSMPAVLGAFILPGEVMSSCAALDSEGHELPPLQPAL